MNSLLINQNNPEHIKLLKASAVAYSKAKVGEVKVTYFFIFLAIAYPICYLIVKNDVAKLVLYGFSFFLTVMAQILTDYFKGNTSKGAILKEEYDTLIFDLPWKSTLKKLERTEIIHLARQYKGEEIKDWYSPNLSPSITHNIAIAILQHSNTSWDIRLRKLYRKLLIAILVFYSIVLTAIFVILKVEPLNIFLLLFSLLAFYIHFISLIRGHSGTIAKREVISKHLNEIIREGKGIEETELRDIQDEIYTTRQESAKVPNFFFRWYKEQMNSEAEEYIAEVNQIYH